MTRTSAARTLKPYECAGFRFADVGDPAGDRERVFGDHFSRDEPGSFGPLREALLERGDYYMHLADLTSYAEAHERVSALCAAPAAWSRKAILNVAASGKFSSDRTIAEYATDIWNAEPCPVP